MKLLIDIGNSRIKWVYSVDGMLETANALVLSEKDFYETLETIWRGSDIPERVYISSVANEVIDEKITGKVKDIWDIEPVIAGVEPEFRGLKIAYRKTSQLGVDRWLALVASWLRYQAPVCVVSCGTAVTIDGISASGQHLGGLITPGIYLQQDLLNKNTGRINLDTENNFNLGLGSSTIECVNNGIVRSIVSLVDNVTDELLSQYGGTLSCIITGGYGERINTLLSGKFHYEPDLVLQGLMFLSESNA